MRKEHPVTLNLSGAPRPKSKSTAVASLVIGILSLPTAGGLVLGALVGAGLGVAALREANHSPETHGGKGLAIAGITTNLLSLVVLAIAIPALMPSRVAANESAALVHIRTLISAEANYSDKNGGQYDTLECLAAPARCVPNYPPSGPTFLENSMLEPVRQHYRRTFYPGPPSDPKGRGSLYSPSSVTAYAIVAEPVEPGRTGVRAFCGDDTGLICYARGGRIVSGKDGRCPRDCTPLE
jgi:type IV pilus assembly protein PilA